MGLSFGFGGGSSKNSYTGTDTYDKTTAPTNPDWVNFGGQSLWNGASALGGANPQSYVAGPNALQTQAGAGASALPLNPSNYDTASGLQSWIAGMKAPQTSAVTANGYVNGYLNPYLDNVVNASMADFDANAGQTRAQQDLQLAKSGAFGGSGSALTIGQTEGQLARARATTDSGLRVGAYNTALTNAQQDAARAQSTNDLNAQLHSAMQDRRLTAANDLVDTANAQGANARADIATQAAAGGALQTIAQQQAQAPLDLQSWLTQQFAGIPTSLYHGTTENGTENQSGNSKGKTSSFSFGFGSK